MLNSPAICDLQFVQYENKDALVGNKDEHKEIQLGEHYNYTGITGFVAMGFVSPDGNPIAVYRGSEGLSFGNDDSNDDWSDNLANMLLGKESTQYEQAENFYKELLEKADGRPIVSIKNYYTDNTTNPKQLNHYNVHLFTNPQKHLE
jgi:hypothetical protein